MHKKPIAPAGRVMTPTTGSKKTFAMYGNNGSFPTKHSFLYAIESLEIGQYKSYDNSRARLKASGDGANRSSSSCPIRSQARTFNSPFFGMSPFCNLWKALCRPPYRSGRFTSNNSRSEYIRSSTRTVCRLAAQDIFSRFKGPKISTAARKNRSSLTMAVAI